MTQIVDMYGRPIRNSDLKTQQTDEARLGHLHRHIADHPTRGLTPAKLAQVLLEAEQGNLISQLELAEDIEEKDSHVFAELQKRRRAVLGVDWRIVPPRDASAAEKDDAALIEQIITDLLDLDDVILDMTDAILKGFSNQEIEWQRLDGLHLPKEISYRDPSWFQLHPDKRNQLRLRDNSNEGESLRPFGWISHVHKAKSGYLGRGALVRILAWPYVFKNLSLRDLAEFLEIYGLPVKLGRYPSGANATEKATLLRAVLGIGHNAGGIIPQGMDIEFKEAAQGAEGPFMAMINWAERSVSKAILGGTLTSGTGEGTNTNALGNVHNEVRKELRDSDLKQVAVTLSRDLVYPLYVLNCRSYSGQRRLPRFEFDITEPAELSSAIYPLMRMVDMGVDDIPVAWLHEKYGIPTASKDEKTLRPPINPDAGPAMLRSRHPKGWAVLRNRLAAPDQQQLDDALQQIEDGELNEQALQLLAPVLALAEQGPDVLQAGLMDLWPDMADDQLQERLAQVLFVAELWGQINGGNRA